jgi:diguanylate cyclase (GGDEF)-like protein
VNALDEHLYAGRIDPDGTYHELYCGRNVERLLGRPLAPGEDSATAWEGAIHPDDLELYLAGCRDLRRTRRVDIEYRMVGADGTVRWLHDRTWSRPQTPGEEGVIVDGIVTDVTERRRTADELLATLAELHQTATNLEQARAEADRLARTDSLTGCYNRRHARELLDVELDRAHRAGTRVGLLALDVDHFKAVNDNHGHHTGDALLLAVATTLRAAVRAGDCVARWGGEEFVVVLPGIERADALTGIAEELRESVAATTVDGRDQRQVAITVSIGAVVSSPAFPSIERLVDAADQALYDAKRAGRNCVVCHPGLDGARAA